ncbi:hypothetical protein B4166_0038 [Caldibacillus thermoamylovorans]|uniref:Uncharacterized protein n=1 Tax=Caldibacillus thermoamylovorans TaxID=35841 RepID=A0ABD4AB83_9BACI|nr:hypothetical protein B4166_0038 [Caldibacillus thermoamylovorans]KIO73627.1 hypothetical protein B4167_0045 [Caldibacillus thermoamylovorans]
MFVNNFYVIFQLFSTPLFLPIFHNFMYPLFINFTKEKIFLQ